MRQRATHIRPFPVALLLGLITSALIGCVDEDAVFVDKPAFQDPTETTNNFLGYVRPVDQKRPFCGNCHSTFLAGWASTGHADAWEDLQASGHASASCEPCHTISENGNPVEGDAGYTLVKDDRYLDHDLLPEKLRELVLKCAGVEIGAATSRERTDQAYGLGRVALCSKCRTGRCRQQGSGEHTEPDQASVKHLHGLPPISLLSGI